jgi:hypothetical protein
MKVLKFIPLALLLLVSCNKEDVLNQEEQNYPITFNVSSLDVDYQPFLRAAPEISTRAGTSEPIYEKFQTLEYFGYRERVQTFKGTQAYNASEPNDFGNVKAQAPAGTYYLGFFGVSNGVGDYRINISSVLGENDYIETNGREIWYKEIKESEITASDNNIDIEMTRKTGRITLNITDQVPANVKRVGIEIYYRSRYRISDGTTPTYTNTTNYTANIPINNNQLGTFEFNCFPNTNAIVNMYIYDSSNIELDKRELTLNVYENRKTIITGELFNNVSGKGFSITVSDDWGEDNIVEIE